MLENRSFDNLAGFLYSAQNNQPPINIPPNGIPTYSGLLAASYWNPANPGYFNTPPVPPDKVFAGEGTSSTTVPDPDPEEDFDDMSFQIFGTRAPTEGQTPGMLMFCQTNELQ